MSTLVITIISLCAIGVVSAVILYFVAQKFKVEEDPRIDIVEGLLPGANCGGCGYPGCRGLAEAAVKSELPNTSSPLVPRSINRENSGLFQIILTSVPAVISPPT